MSTPKDYELINCAHQERDGSCRLCGIYIAAGCQSLKTYRYLCDHGSNSLRYLKTLRKKNSKAKILCAKLDNSSAVFDFLQAIVDKFEFSVETYALGIYLYNHLIDSHSSRTQFVTKHEFYSSVCLMVAAKAIELDKNIPYYSRFVKYSCRQHTKQEYQVAELQLMEIFQWDIQKPTFVTFINYYLSSGIVFSDDQFSRKKVFLVEEKTKEFMLAALKSGEFVTKNQQHAAAQIVDKARKQFKLSWHPTLVAYTGLTVEMFEEVEVLRPVADIQKPQYTPLKSPKPSNYYSQSKELYSTIATEKLRETAGTIKSKSKPQIYRPLISHSQLKFVPSFTALNLLSIKKSESSIS